MTIEQVIEKIKTEGGCEDAKYLGEWNGYKVFSPEIVKGGGFFGPPTFVLERGDNIEVTRSPDITIRISKHFKLNR